jgi:hypothetical protein
LIHVASHPKEGYLRNRKIGYISFVSGGSATPERELVARYIEYTNYSSYGRYEDRNFDKG